MGLRSVSGLRLARSAGSLHWAASLHLQCHASPYGKESLAKRAQKEPRFETRAPGSWATAARPDGVGGSSRRGGFGCDPGSVPGHRDPAGWPWRYTPFRIMNDTGRPRPMSPAGSARAFRPASSL